MTRPLPLLDDAELEPLGTSVGDAEAGFGALATERGPLPLKAMDVRGRIDGLLAQVTVSQTFVNTHDVPLEATYIFPLPDRAGVTSFRMEVAGRVVDGVLQERAQARRNYGQAIAAGHRASIAEEDRPNVFTLRLGNLMPGEHADLHLTLAGPLPYSDGEVTFRFPLVVAPRYIPGLPLSGSSVGDGVALDTDAVPDASRITPPVLLPGYPNPVRLTMAVEIHDCGLNVRDIRSSLHATLQEQSENVRQVLLVPGERLNRDFIVRFRLGAPTVQTALSVHPDAQGDGSEGTFVLTVVPPEARQEPCRGRPRDVVFVLDRSGSMEGWKMVAARRALARMVDTLGDRDRFLVLAFDDRIEAAPGLPARELARATNQNRFRAVEFLAGLGARGGTVMAPPLMLAAQAIPRDEPERDRLIVLVTDGQVGNEDQILRNLEPLCRDLRMFALGIDTAVNAGFLQRLAGASKNGVCELVESEERLDGVLDGIHRRIQSPVLTDLELEPDGLEFVSDSLVPSRRPHLFANTPALILGRFRGCADGGITLRAITDDGQPWHQSVLPQVRENPAIASVWARGRLRDLEDQYVLGPNEALEQRIITTSLQFGVLCRFTAYVAIDRAEIANEGGQVQRIVQPVELPQGWEQPAMLAHPMRYLSLRNARGLGAMPPESAPTSDDVCSTGYAVPPGYLGAPAESGPDDSGIWQAMPPPQADRASASSKGMETRGIPLRSRSRPGGLSGLERIARLGGVFDPRALWRSLLKLMGRRSSEQAAAVPADLPGCRQLARALVTRLGEARQGANAERVAKLRGILLELVALYKGLRARRAGAATLEPLANLLDDYTAIVASQAPKAEEIEQLISRAEALLTAIADGAEVPPVVPPAARPGQFWK